MMNHPLNTTRNLQRFKAPLLSPIMIAALLLLGFVALRYADSVLLLILCAVVSGLQYRTWRRHQRAHYIQHYQIPLYLLHDLRRDYQLDSAQLPLIERGFKDFCLIHLDKPNQLHNMPSKAVDALWHGFILDTRIYADFCGRAFGHTLHHRPSIDMQGLSNSTQQKALKATWSGACQLEKLSPTDAVRLPLLFAIDPQLAWPQGLHYSLDQLQQLLRVDDPSAGDGGTGSSTSIDISDNSDSGGGSTGDSGCGGGCGGD